MYRRDYILRLIERFARALILLRNRLLRREVDSLEAQAALGEVAEQAGLDLNLARQLDPASLLMWLAPGDDVDEPRLWLMGELLYLTALHVRNTGEGHGHGDFRRALAVFGRLPAAWRPSTDLPTAAERIEEIGRILEEDPR